MSPLEQRAQEIATFLGKPVHECVNRLALGFSYQHQQVNDDFRRANPQNDSELLNWYRTTEEYIWELTAYHLDAGFNYSGMCQGIADRLKGESAYNVLCLGDGIGDLTLTLKAADPHRFDPVYHDLEGSLTARFAQSRIATVNSSKAAGVLDIHHLLTTGFSTDPIHRFTGLFSAVVSLDFLEHVHPVIDWISAVKDSLRVGGLMMCQNAFACGSGSDGAIPCHLKVNDIFAYAITSQGELVGYAGEYHAEWKSIIEQYAPNGTDGMAFWDHIVIRVFGFTLESSNWYRKK